MSFGAVACFALASAIWLFLVGFVTGDNAVVLSALLTGLAGYIAGVVAVGELVREGGE